MLISYCSKPCESSVAAVAWYITEAGAYKLAGEAPTDLDGVADFELVPNQKYGVRIETPIGTFPEGDNSVAVASDAVARKTAQQWLEYPKFAELHFGALREILDEEEPGYRE